MIRVEHRDALKNGKPFTAIILILPTKAGPVAAHPVRVRGIAAPTDPNLRAKYAANLMVLLQDRDIDVSNYHLANLTALAREAGYDDDEPGWDRSREAGASRLGTCVLLLALTLGLCLLVGCSSDSTIRLPFGTIQNKGMVDAPRIGCDGVGGSIQPLETKARRAETTDSAP